MKAPNQIAIAALVIVAGAFGWFARGAFDDRPGMAVESRLERSAAISGRQSDAQSVRPDVGWRKPVGANDVASIEAVPDLHGDADVPTAKEESSPNVKKTPLAFGAPPIIAGRGDQYWLRFYHKYGDLGTSEYRRLATFQIKFLHELMMSHADDMLAAGRYYPWSDTEELPSDRELRAHLTGPHALLSAGGKRTGIGRYYVVFSKDEYADVYEAHWELQWLESAASGRPLHRSN